MSSLLFSPGTSLKEFTAVNFSFFTEMRPHQSPFTAQTSYWSSSPWTTWRNNQLWLDPQRERLSREAQSQQNTEAAVCTCALFTTHRRKNPCERLICRTVLACGGSCERETGAGMKETLPSLHYEKLIPVKMSCDNLLLDFVMIHFKPLNLCLARPVFWEQDYISLWCFRYCLSSSEKYKTPVHLVCRFEYSTAAQIWISLMIKAAVKLHQVWEDFYVQTSTDFCFLCTHMWGGRKWTRRLCICWCVSTSVWCLLQWSRTNCWIKISIKQVKLCECVFVLLQSFRLQMPTGNRPINSKYVLPCFLTDAGSVCSAHTDSPPSLSLVHFSVSLRCSPLACTELQCRGRQLESMGSQGSTFLKETAVECIDSTHTVQTET